jgi:hypothetical protein
VPHNLCQLKPRDVFKNTIFFSVILNNLGCSARNVQCKGSCVLALNSDSNFYEIFNTFNFTQFTIVVMLNRYLTFMKYSILSILLNLQ